MDAPLKDLRILDLSRLLPGPYGTMLLADLGAEVIKVESLPEGDPLRSIPPFLADGQSAHYVAVNRNKKSLAVDLKQPMGRQAFLRLVPTADAVLEGFRPGAADRLGIGYDALRTVNPRLVYCSLSGYGQTGPYRSRAGHDINYLALAGALGLTGERDGPPSIPAVQVADLGGGMLAALGILAGVLAARASGVGRYVDASMFDLVASLLGAHAVPCYWASGQVPGREGLPLTGLVPCYRVYQTKDGKHMALGAIEPKFWLAFCRAAGREDLQAAQYDPEAVPVVRQLFLTRTRLEWQALLAGVETCCEPVLDLDEALDGEQMVSRGLVQPLSDAPGLRVVGSPLVMGGTGAAPSPPPRLGEHTTELLRDVGYSDAAIEDMAAQGAVAV